MADSVANLARCDIVISSPKDQRQKQQPVIISEFNDKKNAFLDRLTAVSTKREAVAVGSEPMSTDAAKTVSTTDQQQHRLAVEIPDGAYVASIPACRLSHAR